MKLLRSFSLSLLFCLCTCGDTNLGGSVSITSGGGGGGSQDNFVPGSDLNLLETSQTDFQSGSLSQIEASSGGSLILSRNIIGETGRVDINQEINFTTPTPVTFRNTYISPVIITYIATRNNNESLDARVTNLTSTGAEIFIEDPLDDGIALPETVTYLVVEEGRYDFASGLSIEAGVLNTVSEHSSGDAFGGVVVSFSSAFGVTPSIFHSLNTNNNGDFKTTICDSVTTNQFTVEQETADTGTATGAEEIGWVAITPGQGTQIDFVYDVGTADNGASQGVDNAPQVIPLTGFALAPDLVVKGGSAGGADGYWMRSAGVWTNVSHEGFAEEDQNGDAERAHANETFNYAAFDPDSDIGVYFSSGTRVSEEINLSSVKVVGSSQLQFTATLPAGTSVLVETRVSVDGGTSWSTWIPVLSGGAIPELSSGVDVTEGLLQIRVTLSTTDEEATPGLDALSVNVTASQTAAISE